MRLTLEWILTVLITAPAAFFAVLVFIVEMDGAPQVSVAITLAVGLVVRLLVDVFARALFGPRQKKGQAE